MDIIKLWETLEALFKKIRDAFSTRNWNSLAALWVVLAFVSHPGIAAYLLDEAKFKATIPYDSTTWLLVALALTVLGIGVVLWLAPEPPPPPPPSNVPAIKELLPFEEQDAKVFAQLERQGSIDSCLRAVQDDEFRFGILYSESGNGKTSFLKAGLRPQMLHPERCVHVKFTDLPPLEAVRMAVAERLELPLAGLDQVATFPALLLHVLQASPKPVVFLFDQFEQYFLHLTGPLEEDAFARGLQEWYKQGRRQPVKILVSLRADFMDRLLDLQKVVCFELGDRASFRLEKFSPQQARNVWRIIAQQAKIPFDEAFALHLAEHELASREAQGPGRTDQGRISPVNVQILATMLVGQENANNRAFTEEAFNRLGGVDGLLERFLEQKLAARLTSTRRDVAGKVLLALTDQERNARAGVLTVEQIAEKSSLPPADAQEAVEWLEKARLLTAVEQGRGERGYELAHERLIAPLLKVTTGMLSEAAQANKLLERRVNEWLGNGRSSRFVLTLPEWWKIRRHRDHLVWGEQRQQKEELLARTLSKWQLRVGVAAGALVLALLGWGWWQSETGIIHRSRWELHALAQSRLTDTKAQIMASQDYLLNARYKEALTIAAAKNENIKAVILDSVIDKIGKLRKPALVAPMLESALRMANTIADEYYRSRALRNIAEAAAQLHDPVRAAPILDAAQRAASHIPRDMYKTSALIDVALAAGQLRDPVRAIPVLEAVQHTAGTISEGYDKASVLVAVAEAYGKLHNLARAVPMLEDAKRTALTIPDADIKIISLGHIAMAYGQLHDSARAVFVLDAALHAASSIPDEDDRASALESITEAAGQLSDTVRAVFVLSAAQRMASVISDKEIKVSALSDVAGIYGQLHASARAVLVLNAAQRTADAITDGEVKASALGSIAKAAGQLHDPARAIPVLEAVQHAASTITDGYDKVSVLNSIVDAYRQLDDLVQAVSVLETAQRAASTILNEASKARALINIAEVYGQLHDPARAVLVLDAAQRVTTTIGVVQRVTATDASPAFKAEVLGRIAEVAGQLQGQPRSVQLLEATQRAASTITDGYDKTRVLSSIARAYGQLHHPARAVSVLQAAQQAANTIVNEPSRARALSMIAEATGRLHDPTRATPVLETAQQAASTITNENFKASALNSIAEAAGHLQAPARAALVLEAAQRTTSTITDEAAKTSALSSIARAYAQSALWKQAYNSIEDIQISSRAEPLYRLLEAWHKKQLPPPKK